MTVVPFPPPTPPNTRANATAQVDAHPLDHNRIADALDTILAGMTRRVGGTTSTSTATITTTFTEIMNVPITAIAGRRYRLSGWISGTGNAVVWAELCDAALVRLQLASFHAPSAGLLFSLPIWVEVPPGAAGARTYRLRVATNTGTATLGGGAANPHSLVVDDVGT